MRIPDIIAAKRDGRELSEGEISEIILGYARDSVPDYQMSAFLMAAFIRGLSPGETLSLTRVMVESGRVLNLSCVTGTKVDKHSTGGVGDKTTLIVVPILAACGLKVPKMSGRGLGFTGGTLDKLESIPGFRTALSVEEFAAQVQRIGAAIAGQTRDIVPADKKIYALRDVTATVDSLPLIAASVMSKKIACSADIILLDVKAGSGAFMRDLTSARDLARMMVEIGHGFGRTVGAAITNMDQPLGQAVGNALEVEEAVRVLKGEVSDDLKELCVSLSALALELAGVAKDADKCASLARQALSSGAALAKFAEIVSAQGGDRRVVEDLSLLPRAAQVIEVRSPGSGTVARIDGARLGRAAGLLGAGRERKEDRIDPAAGLTVIKKLGDRVELGEPLALIHTNKTDPLPIAEQMIRDAYVLGSEATIPPLVHEVIR
jgi:pyrimidine-nucleoside phosphorylase